ncbi:CaiB/BaiF CoA transferase family protein [Streptomyces millisiae]|uniref:CaiB/BaiF CoA-transferase family protein n=1 Tax=Streptomyces millisiae TaxID=3075542 RepID=A0ABU2LPN7_9ACTN|nr:CaiB/BaiF CoA-transferase family protein [Streptomyces sp. DSM 44918]MDT0319018.1 CaiB/BaiF CoA-transferase family protein [Streptomyces sp. DSM 44918]
MGDTTGPLAGIRVLELGNFIAAPSAGRLMADFGAEVIKVERPRGGDELRRWRLHEGDTSLLFRTMNRNKRSLTLDLRHPRGRALALDLVEDCDIVLENFRPGTLERWSLGADRLRAANPGLILVRISGYGQTGPYRDRPGFGGVAEAVGGLRHLTGFPDRPPTRVGISLADSVAGLYAVIGALAALHRRRATGRGDEVDIALYEAVYSLMESLTPDYDAFRVERERTGSSLPGVAPSNTYRCADGRYVVIAGNGDSIFRRLTAVIDRPELGEDPRLADNAGRVRHVDELDAAIAAWTAGLPHEEVLRRLDEGQIPSGPIYTAAEISKDPHYAARGMLERHPVTIAPGDRREVAFPGIVPRFREDPGRTRWLGPDLGEHTDAVLAELGVDADRIEELRQLGVV